MLPYKSLLVIQKKSAIPVYRQIAQGFTSLIRSGVMKPGLFLPSSRQLAELLQLHRRTVVAAYEELFSQDWIETIPRKGVRVSLLLPVIKPRTFKNSPKINAYAGQAGFEFMKPGPFTQFLPPEPRHRLILNDGFPDARIAPIDQIIKHYRRFLERASSEKAVMYSDPSGSVRLRQAISGYLSETRGFQTGVPNILVSSGAQMAIFMAARMILKKGSLVLVGEPNYLNANLIFKEAGAILERIPVDEGGIDVDWIEKICKRKKPALLYIIPHHHHPTTVTLSADRRMKLLQLINTYNLPVIEDDYDYDFHYGRSPILPIASADHGGKVIYIGSLSKTIATSIRVGYMVAPENFIQGASVLRRLINIRGDILLEEALAELFHLGAMMRHIRKSAKLYGERRDRFCSLLTDALGDKISFLKPPGGMAAWVTFTRQFPLASLAPKASERGLYMSDGTFYNTGLTQYNALRMGFASLNEKEMQETVSIIRELTKKPLNR